MAADEPCCKPIFWVYLVVCVVLVLFAGLMSGLTLGLMSLSQVDLEVLSKSGQPKDQKNAAKILPVVKNQHLLLCTLLLGNSLAMEALPIFLDALLPAWGAVIISVTLILAFGEIIPQAVCTRFGMSVGAKLAGVVRVLLFVFFPITYPISKLLDWLLGKGHRALLRRAELKTLVDMHGNAAGKGGELTHDETTIITGALDLTQKTAEDAMTPIDKTFALDITSKLDMHTMGLIMSKGHSRVPIYSENPSNIIGLFLVKNLIICRPEDETPIRNVSIRRIPRVPDQMPLYEILNEFQKGHSHMAVVVKGMKDVKRTSESLRNRSTVLGRRVNLSRSQTIAEHKETGPSVVLDVVADPSSSDRSGVANSNLRNGGENQNHTHQVSKEWDREIIVEAELESLPSYPPEEEVVGIITMEDVIEELLQEEIYDETDQYMEAHNRIRVNMPSTRPSPKSSRASSHSNVQQRTPVASPVSSYHHTTPVLQSPISSYVHSPGGSRQSLSSSPARNHFPSSPADQFVTPRQNSPNSNQVSVSRKPDDVLRKPDEVSRNSDEKPKLEDV